MALSIDPAPPVPLRISAHNGPWPLYDAAACKAIESHALARSAPLVLMERAGLAVARLARALQPHAGTVVVWCGPGNNGGDGWVAARLLHASGTRVHVHFVGEANRLPADAARARQLALAAGVPTTPAAPGVGALEPPALVIDALLGLGTTRAPAGALSSAVEQIAQARSTGIPVLAIDLPSGLDPDTGQPFGAPVVQADHTLALLTLKPGLFTAHGRDLAGAVWFDDLGVPQPPRAEGATATMQLGGPPPARGPAPHASHKGSRGDAWVVGGAPGMAGAAGLAARAALAAGAGRVYLSPLDEQAARALDPQRPELMVRPLAQAAAQLASSATTVCGCGGGEAVRAILPELLAQAPRLVLDADALNAIAPDHALQTLLRGRAGRGQGTLITPHPLEAARLLAKTSTKVQAHRIAAARALAERLRCTVVLKGSGSVIATPGEPTLINPTGNAALATAGTGDVLAGWAGGLWAQRPGDSAHTVACEAAWQHGEAADRARAGATGRQPLLAADLISAMAAGGRPR